MRKLLATLLFTFLTLPLTAINKVDQAIQSVAYLQLPTGHCTTFSVGVKRWLSAEHCLAEGEDATINGEDVYIIKQDSEADLVLFSGPLVTPLQFAEKEPALAEQVYLFGWPANIGGKKPLVFVGTVAALNLTEGDLKTGLGYQHRWNLYDGDGGAGMSGGPIVNEAGKVVGMVEATKAVPSTIIAGPTLEEIKRFMK
jgi:hypothetical protein